MAKLPRLPPAVEHHVVKFVCGRPARLQRLLFGPPPVLDGQELAIDVQALLWLDRLVDEDEGLGGSQSVEEKRSSRRSESTTRVSESARAVS